MKSLWEIKGKKYANTQQEQKKATIGQNVANRELKGNTSCKESIVMENPAYIATEHEVGTSPFLVKHRKHVTPGKRQTSLHYRNEEFTIRQMKMLSVTSQEDGSMPVTSKDDIGPLEESEVVIYGNTLNFI